MENLIVIAVIAVIIGLAAGFIHKEKKRGVRSFLRNMAIRSFSALSRQSSPPTRKILNSWSVIAWNS